ncbi:putative oxidoreductase (related to aryl-alcohol dehydrogenase) [Geosmithia morbida]|uniref:Oxidoreductase (Related to aryl-alcohol dehydrogenase) n=1 Tax=Geosmithia morbida TaxID=1094350 RepID=A0A9P5D7T6_9HYPO|nr:putative oxidoreductase (related to aryl-alcohol dehydrogenase) [Geosmithia morbida]KAF4126080.1 putative oxidoreductase (related to aryl-alcohol dehydrogenase) [Geosmithia morbida]
MAPSAITPETSPERQIFTKKPVEVTQEQPSRLRSGSKTIRLNDNTEIPQVALGVYKAPNGQETEDAVTAALDAGYRHIDSAARYANEEACGRAIRRWLERTGTPRSEVFVCSKVWDADHGYEATMNALVDSLDKFGLDYLDLYLVHSPGECEKKRIETWRALETAKRLGKVRSIGVSNFGASQLQHLLDNASIVPTVNQVEVHPFCQREALVDLCAKNGILIESYSPLARGNKLEDPIIGELAKKYNRTPAQILLNWNAARGNIVLPKSLTPSRIQSNLESFDFTLDPADINIINALGRENYVTGSMHKSAD